MRFVVDCSVAIKWVVAEPDTESAVRLLGHELHAPEFIYLESANTLWKFVQRRELTAEQAAYDLVALKRVKIESYAILDMVQRAIAIGCSLNHSIYDCLYLAVAEAVGAQLVTADTRLLRRVAGSAFSHLVISLPDAAAN